MQNKWFNDSYLISGTRSVLYIGKYSLLYQWSTDSVSQWSTIFDLHTSWGFTSKNLRFLIDYNDDKDKRDIPGLYRLIAIYRTKISLDFYWMNNLMKEKICTLVPERNRSVTITIWASLDKFSVSYFTECLME